MWGYQPFGYGHDLKEVHQNKRISIATVPSLHLILGRLKSPAIHIGESGLLRLAVTSSRYCKLEYGGQCTEHRITISSFVSKS